MKCSACDNKLFAKGLCKKCYAKLNYQRNKEKIVARTKQWKLNNPERVKAIDSARDPNKLKEYFRDRYNNDPNYKLKVVIRSRLRQALKGKQKPESAVTAVGCSVQELKDYLESKFLPGMTWENWAQDGWHIDHIKSLDSFDLTDPKQYAEACHYTNLQPMWWQDNLAKRLVE